MPVHDRRGSRGWAMTRNATIKNWALLIIVVGVAAVAGCCGIVVGYLVAQVQVDEPTTILEGQVVPTSPTVVPTVTPVPVLATEDVRRDDECDRAGVSSYFVAIAGPLGEYSASMLELSRLFSSDIAVESILLSDPAFMQMVETELTNIEHTVGLLVVIEAPSLMRDANQSLRYAASQTNMAIPLMRSSVRDLNADDLSLAEKLIDQAGVHLDTFLEAVEEWTTRCGG